MASERSARRQMNARQETPSIILINMLSEQTEKNVCEFASKRFSIASFHTSLSLELFNRCLMILFFLVEFRRHRNDSEAD